MAPGSIFAGRVPGMSRAIVAREYRVCLVAGNLARGLLRDAADHAPRSGSSKIVEQQAGKFRCLGEAHPTSHASPFGTRDSPRGVARFPFPKIGQMAVGQRSTLLMPIWRGSVTALERATYKRL